MKLCDCTTINCGPNVKICGVLVIFLHFESTKDCWESSCPKIIPVIHWLKITSYWLILILLVMLISVQVYYFQSWLFSAILKTLRFLFCTIFGNSAKWQPILKPFAISNCSGLCYPHNNLNLKSVWKTKLTNY